MHTKDCKGRNEGTWIASATCFGTWFDSDGRDGIERRCAHEVDVTTIERVRLECGI
jgi:hypothetical protein